MLCQDTFGSNESEVGCTQLGYVTNRGEGEVILHHHYFDHSYRS